MQTKTLTVARSNTVNDGPMITRSAFLVSGSYVPFIDTSLQVVTECETLTAGSATNISYCSVSFVICFSIFEANTYYRIFSNHKHRYVKSVVNQFMLPLLKY